LSNISRRKSPGDLVESQQTTYGGEKELTREAKPSRGEKERLVLMDYTTKKSGEERGQLKDSASSDHA